MFHHRIDPAALMCEGIASYDINMSEKHLCCRRCKRADADGIERYNLAVFFSHKKAV